MSTLAMMIRSCALSALLIGASACAIQPAEADPEPASSSAEDPAGSDKQDEGRTKDTRESSCTTTPAGHIFCCFWTNDGTFMGCDD